MATVYKTVRYPTAIYPESHDSASVIAVSPSSETRSMTSSSSRRFGASLFKRRFVASDARSRAWVAEPP